MSKGSDLMFSLVIELEMLKRGGTPSQVATYTLRCVTSHPG